MSGADPFFIAQPSAQGTVRNAFKNVAVAGTAEALVSSSTPCVSALIQAKPGNAGNVFVGGASVPNTSNGGIVLIPGNAINISCNNLAQVYVNAANNGDGVTIVYWTIG